MLIRGLLLVLLIQVGVLLTTDDYIPPFTGIVMDNGCPTLYPTKSIPYLEPLIGAPVPKHHCENGSANGQSPDRRLATVSPCRWGM